MKELPMMNDLELVYVSDKINSILSAHEAHAKEMIDEWEKSDMHGKTLNEWRGYLKAIQALKGEVKK